jgi:hypothetical protein
LSFEWCSIFASSLPRSVPVKNTAISCECRLQTCKWSKLYSMPTLKGTPVFKSRKCGWFVYQLYRFCSKTKLSWQMQIYLPGQSAMSRWNAFTVLWKLSLSLSAETDMVNDTMVCCIYKHNETPI